MAGTKAQRRAGTWQGQKDVTGAWEGPGGGGRAADEVGKGAEQGTRGESPGLWAGLGAGGYSDGGEDFKQGSNV